MFRTVCALVLLVLGLFYINAPVLAGEGPVATNNPEHRGYVRNMGYSYPVNWEPVTTNCDPCTNLVNTYNQTMQSLLTVRFKIEDIGNINEKVADDAEKIQKAFDSDEKRHPERTGVPSQHEGLLSYMLNRVEASGQMRDQIPQLEALERQLKESAAFLRKEIESCEKQCQQQDGKTAIAVDPGQQTGAGLPFDWRGPYPDVCHKCAKLAARLNELPAITRRLMADLQRARAQKALAELKIMEMRAFSSAALDGGTNDDFWARRRNEDAQSIKEVERDIARAEEQIESAQRDLDAVKRNFDETLALYNECVPTCLTKAEQTQPPGGCQRPSGQKAYLIGPNDKFGTGAQMKEKVKNMATGAARSAIGGMMGGGSMGAGGMFGGGDDGDSLGQIGRPDRGSRGPSGPKTESDPVDSDFTRFVQDGVDLGVRAGFTDDGFVVSQKVFDSPDGSTFHGTWLEDGKGRKQLPVRYYIFSLYMDHKLTIWWTYDHWTNGVHDKHEEGRETTQWQTHLGDFKVRLSGEDGMKNSIWYQSGFETAVKGVRSIGALYNIAPAELAGPCPVSVVTHLTMPGGDPVTTMPFVLGLSVKPEDAERREPDVAVINY